MVNSIITVVMAIIRSGANLLTQFRSAFYKGNDISARNLPQSLMNTVIMYLQIITNCMQGKL